MDIILIGVCTYKRPQMLRACLQGLAQMGHPVDAVVRVVVVDNDPDTTHDPAALPYPGLIYEREPQRGIPHARNRVLDVARRIDADYIAFIDDDEIPAPNWIAEMYTLLTQKRVDVVRGRVIYERNPNGMATTWEPPEREKHIETGTPVTAIATNNVLFAAWIARDLRFSSDMPLGIGEDRDYFWRAIDRGAKCIYHHEAITYETIPPERETLYWCMKRRFDMATSDTRYRILREGWSATADTLLWKAVKRMVTGCVQMLLYPVSHKTGIRGLRRVAWGAGVLRGLLGMQAHHYRDVTGY